MDVNEAREKRELKDRNVELENEIELRQQQIDEAEQEKESLEKEVSTLKRDLEFECENRRRIALELGIDESASRQEVMKKLRELKLTSTKDRRRVEEMESQFTQATTAKEQLEEQLKTANKQCDHLNFLIRQKELEIFKLCGRRKRFQSDQVQVEVTPLPQKLFEFPTSHSTLTARQVIPDIANVRRSSRPSRGAPVSSRRSVKWLYCILCRQYYDPDEDSVCRVHHKPMKASNGEQLGTYACCGDQTPWSVGCLRVRHIYAVYNEREDQFELSNGFMTIRPTLK